jgi:hypothetical protein
LPVFSWDKFINVFIYYIFCFMKKIFLLSFLILPLLLFTGAGCSDSLPEDQQVDYEEDVAPLIEEVDGDYKVRGSCNVVAEKSTCIDYVGSLWDQPEQKELNCSNVGVYSDNTCPYSELGGCQMGGGTFTEVITWHYGTGGQAFTAEDAYYAAQACNTLPMGTWVGSDHFLQ